MGEETRTILRLSTAGSVDDGKSTLIGRLLMDLHAIHEDTIASVAKTSKKLGVVEEMSLALVTDGLRAEQEQGITIDVAYRYFTSKKRRFILADSPGHEQYTRNMATAASTADLTIILVDATKGILPQTKRHAFVASLMGVPRLLVAVNKMDLVGFSESTFEAICASFSEFAAKLGIREVRFIPISALQGDNVVEQSTRIPWYRGETILEYLEHVYIGGDRNMVDFRFPVQCVIRGDGVYRGYAGRIASGSIQAGEEIMVLPSLRRSKVKKIEYFGSGPEGLQKAQSPQSVLLCLEDEIDIARGNVIVRPQNAPPLKTHFEAMVVWMSETPLDASRQYIVRHTTAEAKVYIDQIAYRIDVESLARNSTETLKLNDIGRIAFTSSKPLAIDPYQKNRATGNFILIDAETFATVAAGMEIERMPEEMRSKLRRSENLHREDGLISDVERRGRTKSKAMTVWLSGLSGAGKSSIAKALERKLFDLEIPTYRLDGDNLRGGLNRDLGFSQEDRSENLRRAAEVSKLMNEAGLVVLASFITPREADREVIQSVLGPEKLLSVYLSTPLSVCEERDPHGLYKKSRAGLIREFTGVSSPFEEPANPDLSINTADRTIEQCAEEIAEVLLRRAKV
ncbi:MAG: adenylyl-sulfate kinase [Deltaproteobacteria bacterium]|nr:adenylyl-sulfate kinase [Deltaproteobacteria bacterium]